MSEADFVRASGISSSTVSQWATGKRTPGGKSCERIAEALGISVDEVLEAADIRPPDEELTPDDPRRNLIAKVKRVKWNAERQATIEALLDLWRADDLAGRTPQ
jgi:transcriptional regulator with XRE-family HTH domain